MPFGKAKDWSAPKSIANPVHLPFLLARMPKRTYMNNETFTAKLEIYHYGEHPLKRGKLNWELKDGKGNTVKKRKYLNPSYTLCYC